MPRRSLTDRALKSLKQDTSDAVVPGLAVRIGSAGQKTFVVIARFPGSSNPTRRRIGSYPAMSLEQARSTTRTWLEKLQAGIDPGAELEAVEASPAPDTFRTVAENFIAKHVVSRRTATDIARLIRGKLIAAWGDRPIDTITRRDVIALIETDATDSGAGSARKVLAYSRRLFRWAAARDLVTVNPCAAIAVADFLPAEISRDRVLDDSELALLLRATAPDGGAGYPDAPYVRLLCYSAVRRREAANLSWSELSPDLTSWLLPAARVKNASDFLIPLPPVATKLLASLPRFVAGDFVFTSTGGQRPIGNFGTRKDRLDRRMTELNGGIAIPAWTYHDIRRSVASGMARLGVLPHAIEAVLNHRSGAVSGIAAIYNRYDMKAEKAHALALWADHLDRLEHGEVADNVVRIRP
jgi:integrase